MSPLSVILRQKSPAYTIGGYKTIVDFISFGVKKEIMDCFNRDQLIWMSSRMRTLSLNAIKYYL